MLFSILALSLSIGLPAQDAKPAAALDLLRAVPKDAWMFAEVRDLDALRGDLEKNAFWTLYQDPESAALRDSFEKALSANSTGEKKPDDSGQKLLEFLGAVHGSMLLYLAPPASGTEPDLVMVVEPGSPRAAFEKLYDQLLESESKKSIASSSTYAGVELKILEEKPADPKPGAEATPAVPVHHSVYLDSGTFAVFTLSTSPDHALELAHATIDRLRGTDVSEGIAANPRYLDAKASSGARGRVEVFVDLAQLLPAALADRKSKTESEDKILAGLGFTETRWGYLTADLSAGEQLRLDLCLALPEKGLLRDLAGLLGRLPREAARAFPKESQGVTLYALDVPGLWKWIWDLVQVTNPGQAEASRAQIAAAGQAMGGIDIEKDIVGQLTGEFGMNMIEVPGEEWLAANGAADSEEEDEPAAGADAKAPAEAPKGGSFGEAWWIGLHDTKAFSSTLESLLEATGASESLETEDFQGKTVWTMPSPTGSGPLSYSFTNKGLVISSYPSALRAALRMEGKEPKESALEREAFKPVFAENGEAGMFSISHTAAMLKSTLGAMSLLTGQFAASSGADSPLGHLPSAEALDRHFQGTATTTLRHKTGVLALRFSMR